VHARATGGGKGRNRRGSLTLKGKAPDAYGGCQKIGSEKNFRPPEPDTHGRKGEIGHPI